MSLAKKVALNTIFQLVGRIMTVFIALIIVVYLTRYLGVEGYGYYTTIIAYLGLFTILADFGFYMIAAREMAQKKKSQGKEKDRKILHDQGPQKSQPLPYSCYSSGFRGWGCRAGCTNLRICL